jgi:superoxide dismutase, Fe-Mn family
MSYAAHTFTIPELKGISRTTIDEHIKLYEGYVKHANLILEKIEQYAGDETKVYDIGELRRRFAFEYDGMRNHEIYFSSLEGGATVLDASRALASAITTRYGSFDAMISKVTALALTRGIGWAVVWFDAATGALVENWVDEQHLGQLSGAHPIVMVDVWEHSYVADYLPSGKKKYVEDYLANINWNVVADRYDAAAKFAIA